MSTTQRIKSQFPDLNFVKPLPVDKHPRYTEYGITFNPNQHLILSKGHVKEEGRKKMLVDCVVNRDTPIPLRDGLHVYADVYRPATSDDVKVPVVICWSPYGKSSISLDKIWHRSGVPRDWTSGYETFEGLDPAEWCKRGYAIVNVDARGTQFSEGTFFSGETKRLRIYMTRLSFCLDSRGATDLFAWEEARTWQKPKLTSPRQSHPALKALAPYEGFTDIYRQLFRRGGFSMNNIFAKWYQWGVSGNYEVEDMAKMVKTHSLFDDYWAGKLDQVTNIDDIPLYLLGSFSNPFHVYGSFDTFRHASSTRKWMRVHSTFEWYELYERKSNDDLHRFFDRYCKGIKNGWEQDTPLLRLSLHGFGSIPNIVERTETEFPLRRQRLEKYYLEAATKTIHATARDSKSSVSHDGHGLDASSDFILKFSEYTEIAGYSKVCLWMSCEEKDDMDVVVQIRKVDSSGSPLEGVNFPCPLPESEVPEGETSKLYGPQGFLRASSSVSRDEERSSPDGQEVFYRHDRERKIPPGTIVPLEITLWPMGMVFAANEGILLRVAGHFLSAPSTGVMKPQEPDDENIGQHYIHTGGSHDSCLILPVVAGSRA